MTEIPALPAIVAVPASDPMVSGRAQHMIAAAAAIPEAALTADRRAAQGAPAGHLGRHAEGGHQGAPFLAMGTHLLSGVQDVDNEVRNLVRNGVGQVIL